MYLHKQLQITGAQLTQTDHQLICSYHKTWKMSVRLTILLFQVSLELKLLKEYLYRTKHLRKDSSKLLISYVKPHKDVSRDTVARWIKTVLHRSGIDTKIDAKTQSLRSGE
jgi:CRISPR/Cas system-associated exonuclease Cas4 (RecB family)